MGFFSGIASAVGSFIGGVASKIGSSIGGFAKGAFGLLSKIPIPGMGLFSKISAVANVISSVLGFLGVKSEKDPEILGAKADQCDKKLKDFDNDVEAYIKHLVENVKLDKEKYEKLSENDKLACKTVGMSLEVKAIEQKIGGILISPECMGVLLKLQAAGIKIDPKTIVEVVKALKEQGIINMNDVAEYLLGKGESDRMKTGVALANALGSDANNLLNKLQDAARKYEGGVQ